MAESPSEYFAQRGFELLFTSRSPEEIAAMYEQNLDALPKKLQREVRRTLAEGGFGPVLACLRSSNGGLIDGYGVGTDEDSAGFSALRRWRSEQGD